MAIKTIKEIKEKIEYLIESPNVWEVDLSLTLMRKKLKEVLIDITEFQEQIENYIKSEIQRILNQDIPKYVNNSQQQFSSNLEPRLKQIENNINILYDNDIIIKNNVKELKDIKIKEIKGDYK